MRLEVRCCCQPNKLLGWVNVNPNHVIEGQAIRLPCMVSIHDIQSRVYPFVELHVGRIAFPDNPRGYPAIMAEHVSIETLRTIASFEEARE